MFEHRSISLPEDIQLSPVLAANPLDLLSARVIAKEFVNTPENFIHDPVNLNSGKYSMRQVRYAYEILAREIMGGFGPLPEQTITKPLVHGVFHDKLWLTVYQQRLSGKHYPQYLNMRIIAYSAFMYETHLPLRGSRRNSKRDEVRFLCFDGDTLASAQVGQLRSNFDLSKYQVLRRGWRWMGINLLSWSKLLVHPSQMRS